MATNYPIPVVYESEAEMIHHLPDRPFCGDDSCPCRADDQLFMQYIVWPFLGGLMTDRECADMLVGNLPGEQE